MTGQEPQKIKPTPNSDRQIGLDEWDDLVADRYKVPRSLMKSMASQESGGNVNAKSPTGVVGKYQVTESTAKMYNLDRNDPFQQSVAAAKHLRAQYDSLKHLKSDDERWLGAVGRYYGGGDAVQGDSLSSRSVDGLSNPAEHVKRVAVKWGEQRRSESGQQPAATAAQPSGIPQGSVVGHDQNTPRPLPSPISKPSPRVSKNPTGGVFAQAARNQKADQTQATIDARNALNFRPPGGESVRMQEQANRINRRVNVDPKKRAEAERFQNRSALGQAGEVIGHGFLQGAEMAGQTLGTMTQHPITTAYKMATTGKPAGNLLTPAAQQAMQEQQAAQDTVHPNAAPIGRGLTTAATQIPGTMILGPAKAAQMIGGGAIAATQQDWSDPGRAAIGTTIGALGGPLGSAIGKGVSAPVVGRLATPAARSIAEGAGQVVGGAAGNVIPTAAEQLAYDGELNAQKLAHAGVIGGAQALPGLRSPNRIRQQMDQAGVEGVAARAQDRPGQQGTTITNMEGRGLPSVGERLDRIPGRSTEWSKAAPGLRMRPQGGGVQQREMATRPPQVGEQSPQVEATAPPADFRTVADGAKMDATAAEQAGNFEAAAAQWDAARQTLTRLRRSSAKTADPQTLAELDTEINLANQRKVAATNAGRAAARSAAKVQASGPQATPRQRVARESGPSDPSGPESDLKQPFSRPSRPQVQQNQGDLSGPENAPTRDLTAPLLRPEARVNPEVGKPEIAPMIDGDLHPYDAAVKSDPARRTPLTQSYRAGMNNGEIVFPNQIVKDLYLAATGRNRSRRAGNNPIEHNDYQSKIESLAERLGKTPDEVSDFLYDFSDNAKLQLKGIQDGESRTIDDTAVREWMTARPQAIPVPPPDPAVERLRRLQAAAEKTPQMELAQPERSAPLDEGDTFAPQPESEPIRRPSSQDNLQAESAVDRLKRISNEVNQKMGTEGYIEQIDKVKLPKGNDGVEMTAHVEPPLRPMSLSGQASNRRHVRITWDNPNAGIEYKSPHHQGQRANDLRNILFDVMVEDRQTQQGEDAIFLSEGQSDWHQKKGNPSGAPYKNNWLLKGVDYAVGEAAAKGKDGVLLPKSVEQIYKIQGWGDVREQDGRYLDSDGTDVTPVVRRYLKELPEVAAKIARKNGVKLGTRTIETENGPEDLHYLPLKKGKADAPKVESKTVEVEPVVKDSLTTEKPVADEVDFSQLAEQDAANRAERAEKPQRRKMTGDLSPIEYLKRKTDRQGFRVTDKGEARRLGSKESGIVGLTNRRSKWSTHDAQVMLDEGGFLMPDGREFTDPSVTETDMLSYLENFGKEKRAGTAELNRRLAEEESAYEENRPATAEFQPDSGMLRDVAEYGRTPEPDTPPIGRRQIRPPAPQQPRAPLNRPTPSDVNMSASFPRARRAMVEAGKPVQEEITAGRGKAGPHGKFAEAMFKSSSGKVLHGQDSFFHDPQLKGKLGLTRDAEQGAVKKELTRQLSRLLRIKEGEVSLTQIEPKVWRQFAAVKNLGPDARAKMELAIQRGTETNGSTKTGVPETDVSGRGANRGSEAVLPADPEGAPRATNARAERPAQPVRESSADEKNVAKDVARTEGNRAGERVTTGDTASTVVDRLQAKTGEKYQEIKKGKSTAMVALTPEGDLHLISVRTPAASRGKGEATSLIGDIVKTADDKGLTIKLEASPLDRRTNLAKLVKLYEKFGFRRTGKTINPAGDPEMVRAPNVARNAAGVEADRGAKTDVLSRAIGDSPSDETKVSVASLGLPVKNWRTQPASAKTVRKAVNIDDITLSREDLSKGRMRQVADTLKDGVKESGGKIDPIEVVPDPDAPGKYVVSGDGNHRVAYLKLSGHQGDVPVVAREVVKDAARVQETVPNRIPSRTREQQLATVQEQQAFGILTPKEADAKRKKIEFSFGALKNEPQGPIAPSLLGGLQNLGKPKADALFPPIDENLKRTAPPPIIPRPPRSGERPERPRRAVAPESKTTGQKGKENVVGALSLPRALMSSADISAPLRQGAILTLPPSQWGRASRAFVRQLRAFKTSEYDKISKEIADHPDATVAKDAGLHLATDKLTPGEEDFFSKFADNIPLVKQSGQAYKVYLDSLRMDTFAKYKAVADKHHSSPEARERAYKASAEWINIATGRGSLGKSFDNVANTLGAIFFAPRYTASRIQVLNPMTYAKNVTTPEGRTVMRQQMTDLVQFAGMTAATLALAKAAGATVSTNADDPDFLKIRVGNVRYDTLAGTQQIMRLFYRMGGDAKLMAQGKEAKRNQGAGDIALRFGRSKLAPVPSYFVDAVNRKDFVGRPFRPVGGAVERMTPLMWRDFYEAYQREGFGGAAKMSPGLLGVGVSNYDAKKPLPRK